MQANLTAHMFIMFSLFCGEHGKSVALASSSGIEGVFQSDLESWGFEVSLGELLNLPQFQRFYYFYMSENIIEVM